MLRDIARQTDTKDSQGKQRSLIGIVSFSFGLYPFVLSTFCILHPVYKFIVAFTKTSLSKQSCLVNDNLSLVEGVPLLRPYSTMSRDHLQLDSFLVTN